MRIAPHHELPLDKQRIHAKAVRLEWFTIAYLITAITVIYLTLGASQAMKTAWFEDMLSLIPPLAFLVASRVRKRPPDAKHPYGFHSAVSIAYLVASLALAGMGAFLLYDSIAKLLAFEHPSIGTVRLFDHEVWLGWLMIPAAAYSGLPAMLIGRKKLPLANALHDKVLYADAKMNKADWLTAMAAILGILGIAVGFWWADAVAASVISFDILHDGISNIRAAIADLMDRVPERVDDSGRDPLPQRIATEMSKLDWVADTKVRMREEGHVYVGEVFVIASDARNLVAKIEDAVEMIRALDWRAHDVVIMPVRTFDDEIGATAT